MTAVHQESVPLLRDFHDRNVAGNSGSGRNDFLTPTLNNHVGLSTPGGPRRAFQYLDLSLPNKPYVAEYPVPTSVNSVFRVAGAHSNETSHLRYTAATCDPDDFTLANGWSLRTHASGRQTELLIAITSYNEEASFYTRTLQGVASNIRDICKGGLSNRNFTQGDAEHGVLGWQNIVVALVVDGVSMMDKSVLEVLSSIGVYQEGLMKHKVDGKYTTAHIFEYTAQVDANTDYGLTVPQDIESESIPIQMIVVLKTNNQKKLNSHRWLFNGIGNMLQPEICVLVDVGTKPGPDSIYHLWDAFQRDSNLGGCCGDVVPMIKGGRKLLNPLIATQNFEYKIANILDKPLESTFGYLAVLPGAFSAYRYRAIQGDPLQRYFMGDMTYRKKSGDNRSTDRLSTFEKNMFLSEDRILCFELVAKAGECWKLGYVFSSKAETDVPESPTEFIKQRRRWLNGSFATSLYALLHFRRMYRSGHSVFRLALLHLQFIYNIVALTMSWFSLAILWLGFSVLIDIFHARGVTLCSPTVFPWLSFVLKCVYCGLLVLQFVLALQERPGKERLAYKTTLWLYSLMVIYFIFCSFQVARQAIENFISLLEAKDVTQIIMKASFQGSIGPWLATTMTVSIYLFVFILFGDPWHLFTSLIQYLCLTPSLTNVLNVYAFCNVHDVSWGTKGISKSEPTEIIPQTAQPTPIVTFEKQVLQTVKEMSPESKSLLSSAEDKSKVFRTRLVTGWMLTNGALALGIDYADVWGDIFKVGIWDALTHERLHHGNLTKRNDCFAIILYATFFLAVVRWTGCMCYWLNRNFSGFLRRLRGKTVSNF